MIRKIVIIEICYDCPHFEETMTTGYCREQEKYVDGFKMDENCPLLTIHQDFIDIAKKRQQG